VDKPEVIPSRYLNAAYCDDVRAEVGNKYSLMGVYQADLLVPAFPALLPRLCIVLTAHTPIEQPFRELTFQVTKDEIVMLEHAVPAKQLSFEDTRPSFSPKAQWRWLKMSMVLQISPFEIADQFLLRPRAITESEVLKGEALVVRATALPPTV